MNIIEINKGDLKLLNKTCDFCDRRFLKTKNNKCKPYIENAPTYKISICPYGISMIRGYLSSICGFVCDKYFDSKRIDYYEKYKGKKLSFDKYNNESSIRELIRLIDYCYICSPTVHELIHFGGQLKSLISTVRESYRNLDDDITRIIAEYQKYVSLAETYYKKNQELSKKSKFKSKCLNELVDYCREKSELYSSFIGGVKDINSRMIKRLNNLGEYSKKYAKRPHVISLLAMESLFDYRIKYHEIYKSEALQIHSEVSDKTMKYNWHQVAKRLTKTFESLANNKNVQFNYVGNTFYDFIAKENLYLALYIIFENAVKYAPMGSEIILNFDENVVSIKNKSDHISENSMNKITQKGFSGENSKDPNSNGLGLFLVKKILDDNNFKYNFKYNNHIFSVSIAA